MHRIHDLVLAHPIDRGGRVVYAALQALHELYTRQLADVAAHSAGGRLRATYAARAAAALDAISRKHGVGDDAADTATGPITRPDLTAWSQLMRQKSAAILAPATSPLDGMVPARIRSRLCFPSQPRSPPLRPSARLQPAGMSLPSAKLPPVPVAH